MIRLYLSVNPNRRDHDFGSSITLFCQQAQQADRIIRAVLDNAIGDVWADVEDIKPIYEGFRRGPTPRPKPDAEV